MVFEVKGEFGCPKGASSRNHQKKYFSGSEIDIHSTGEDGVQGQVSVYSKIKIRAEDGFTKVSSLEAPSG